MTNINPRAFEACAAWTRRTGNEYGCILEDNRIIASVPGNQNSVNFVHQAQQLEWNALVGAKTDIVHSHPVNVPLSPQDLGMAARFKTGMHVITPDGTKLGFSSFAEDKSVNVDLACAILSGASQRLALRDERYATSRLALRQGNMTDATVSVDLACQLLFVRGAASHGILNGYYEELGPRFAEEAAYLKAIGISALGDLR